MHTRPLGNSGIVVSPVIMGTWQAGKQYWVGIDDQLSIDAIQAALGAGTFAFDTAEEYGEGHSERILGKALAGRRHQAVIMSKVFSNHLHADQVVASCHRSLKNLATDYLDLYQIHWPAGSWGSDAVPIEETMSALLSLKEQGKIRAIGVSNFNRAQLEEAAALGQIDSVQPPYSLFWRHAESEILPWCRANNATLLAYSPLAQGILADRFSPDHKFEKGDHRHANKLFLPRYRDRVQNAMGMLRNFAQQRNISCAQLALAWLCHRDGVCAIAGARNADQARANSEAMDIVLSKTELDAIDEIGNSVANPLRSDPIPWSWQP